MGMRSSDMALPLLELVGATGPANTKPQSPPAETPRPGTAAAKRRDPPDGSVAGKQRRRDDPPAQRLNKPFYLAESEKACKGQISWGRPAGSLGERGAASLCARAANRVGSVHSDVKPCAHWLSKNS